MLDSELQACPPPPPTPAKPARRFRPPSRTSPLATGPPYIGTATLGCCWHGRRTRLRTDRTRRSPADPAHFANLNFLAVAVRESRSGRSGLPNQAEGVRRRGLQPSSPALISNMRRDGDGDACRHPPHSLLKRESGPGAPNLRFRDPRCGRSRAPPLGAHAHEAPARCRPRSTGGGGRPPGSPPS